MLQLGLITKFYWLICWGSVVVLLHGKAHGHLGNSSTIYVDCGYGNDTVNCGLIWNTPCKSLQFVISERVQQLTTSNLQINIVSGECKENGVLRFNNAKTKISHWSFNGSTETSRSATIVQFSVESFNSAISFSHLTWQNSSDPTSFNVHMSKVTFQHCILEYINFQFTGLHTNLLIQNTAISHCSSQSTDIPLFFMQTLYNYDTKLFIQNSTFSYNKRPIIYAMQFQEIFMENTLFLKNGEDILSNLSMLTVSGSSVILKNSIFNHTLGTAIEVKNVKNFKANKVAFLSNNGSTGSCLVVKKHSNVSLVDTIFKQNTNPVVFIKDNDGVDILFKACTFGCIQDKEEMNLPFLKASTGSNITATNCSIAKLCSVHCKNGEFVKFHLYCEKCLPGSFSYDENNVILTDCCQSCPAGTYTSRTGSTNCSLCGEGTYAQKSGNEDCKKCTNDFFTSDAGAKSCSKMTLEFILIVAATVPLIIIPLILLFGRILKNRSLKLKARFKCGKNYDRFGQNVTTNAVKDIFSQGEYSCN